MLRMMAKWDRLFWVLVVVPSLCSAVYFSFWASDVYISESAFVVRTPQSQASLSGMGALLQNVGFSRSQDDSYSVLAFMRSREALAQLQEVLPVRSFYEEEGDFFSRFNPLGFDEGEEAFYQYFQNYLSVSLDSVSGIATLRVRAFKPDEAQAMSVELLRQGELLINRLNERAKRDSVVFAEELVREAEVFVAESAAALSAYRINNGVFDVQAESEVLLALVAGLQEELISIETQLAQLRSLAPNNPQIETLLVREASVREEMDRQMRLILGGGASIATQTAEYQRLLLSNRLAQEQLSAALVTLQNARSEAERKQLYLEVVTQPSRPDLALEPRRLYSVLATFFFGLLLYGVLRLLIASIKEHKN